MKDRYEDLIAQLSFAFSHRLHHRFTSPHHQVQLIDLSLRDVQALGNQLSILAKSCSDQSWLFTFDGELGSGKTALIKALARGLGFEEKEVQSPTFSYLMVLEGSTALYHFDLYRMKSCDDFECLGFEEHLDSSGICCIEWVEKIAQSTILRQRPRLHFALQFGRLKSLRNICLMLSGTAQRG